MTAKIVVWTTRPIDQIAEMLLTQGGLAVARSQGKTLGRPKVRRDRDPDAKRIRELRNDGQSYREIAEELGRSTMDVYRVAMTLGRAGTEH